MRKLIGGLLLAVTLMAQDTPVVSDASKVKILQAQLAQQKLALQYQQLDAQIQQLRAAYPKAVQDQKEAEDAAFKAAGLDRKEWVLDESNNDVKFVPAPKPTESKKEDKK